MKNRLASVIVGSGLLLSACPTLAQSSPQTTAVRVYDATEIAMARYTVIKRLWVESWQSAFEIPTYATAAAGTQVLIDAAARLGADGVVNVTCIPGSSALRPASGYRCYGNAIRLKAR